MKIIREDGTIKVESPYSADFVARAKEIKGKWDRPYWVFPEKVAERLNEILIAVYGEGFEKMDTVDIEIDLDTFMTYSNHEVVFKGLTVARRPERDRSVVVSENAYVKAGGFEASGGSRAYPRVTWKPGTVIILTVPVTLAEDLPKGVTLLDTSLKSKLEGEKVQLLKRLAEIEDLLKSM